MTAQSSNPNGAPAGDDELLAQWQALSGELAAWQGDVGQATALLARLKLLKPFKGGNASQELLDLRKLKANPDKVLRGFAAADSDSSRSLTSPSLPAALRPMAAAGAETWPWQGEQNRQTLQGLFAANADEGRQISWRLAALATHVAPLADSLDYLRCVFCLVRREHWIPVAVAMAAALVGDRADTLAGLGLEQACRDVAKAEHVQYDKRHLKVLGCLVADASGRVFGGSDAAAWRKMFENDASDLSALASACAYAAVALPAARDALAQTADWALQHALTRHSAGLIYQHAEAARSCIDTFGDTEASWNLLLRSGSPTDPVNKAAERMWDALETVLWMRASGKRTQERRFLAEALSSAPLLATVLDCDATSWLPRLSSALLRLQDAHWRGSPPASRAAAMVEALALCTLEVASEVSWRDAVASADALWIEPSAGQASECGWVDLVGLASSRGTLFSFLLHRKHVDPRRQTPTGAPDPLSYETAGLSRLLRARWRWSDASRPGEVSTGVAAVSGWVADHHLTGQCAGHVARRLALADEREAARILLAVITADVPPTQASRVPSAPTPETAAGKGANAKIAQREQGKQRDGLWAQVQDTLPGELRPGRLDTALTGLQNIERCRGASALENEAREFAAVTGLFPELQAASGCINAAWDRVQEAAAGGIDCIGGNWTIGGRPTAPASAEAVRAWMEREGNALARALAAAATAVQDTLATADEAARTARVASVAAVAAAAKVDVVHLELPVLDASCAAIWREAAAALRQLGHALPFHVEAALDKLLDDFGQWIAHAEANALARNYLVERVEHAMRSGNEGDLKLAMGEGERNAAITRGQPDAFQLLDEARLRKIGHFWQRRMQFGEAKRLPKHVRVNPWTYYGPLVLGVVGAPLTTVQADALWQPLLGDPSAVAPMPLASPWLRLVAVNALFATVCGHALWQEIRNQVPDLPPREAVLRATVPLGILIALNYGLNAVLWWIAAPNLDPLTTVVLWGTLSLYLGLFIGLLAQGARLSREEPQSGV